MDAESVARDQREGEDPDDAGIVATVSIAAFEGDRTARSRGVGGRVVSWRPRRREDSQHAASA